MFPTLCRRKWLPPPLRKLSQGKVDKTSISSSSSSSSSAASVVERPLVKKASEKTFKLATSITAEEETQPLTTTVGGSSASSSISAADNDKKALDSDKNAADNVLYRQRANRSSTSQQPQEFEAEEEAGFELPPPMKPIQDSQAIINNGPTVSSTSSAVEQSPCKRVSWKLITLLWNMYTSRYITVMMWNFSEFHLYIYGTPYSFVFAVSFGYPRLSSLPLSLCFFLISHLYGKLLLNSNRNIFAFRYGSNRKEKEKSLYWLYDPAECHHHHLIVIMIFFILIPHNNLWNWAKFVY